MTEPTRVVLFDDAPRNNSWVTSELSAAGIHIVGEASDVETMRDLARTAAFDVAVLDVLVGPDDDLTGLRIGLWLRIHRPEIGILMLTSYDSEAGALRLLTANPRGVGYLVKHRVGHAADIVHAIGTVRDGRNVFDTKIEAALLPMRGKDQPGDLLNPIEMETLRLIVDGHTNEAIAKRLGVRPKTIDARCTAIFTKLGIADDEGPEKRNRRVRSVVRYLTSLEQHQQVSALPPVDWPPPPGRD